MQCAIRFDLIWIGFVFFLKFAPINFSAVEAMKIRIWTFCTILACTAKLAPKLPLPHWTFESWTNSRSVTITPDCPLGFAVSQCTRLHFYQSNWFFYPTPTKKMAMKIICDCFAFQTTSKTTFISKFDFLSLFRLYKS